MRHLLHRVKLHNNSCSFSQRFRFCGDLDAPDWLMTEMSVLSKIVSVCCVRLFGANSVAVLADDADGFVQSSVRMKILSKQVILQLLGNEIDYEKVLKMTKDTFDNVSDVKAAIAGLDFIIANAAKYDIDDNTLGLEIQQLGLPKENSDALLRTYRDSKEHLRQRLAETAFKLQRLESLDWRVDSLLSSNTVEELNVPAVQLKLGITPLENNVGETEVSFEMTADKFAVLFSELKAARRMMDTLEA
eukprot:g120.t1